MKKVLLTGANGFVGKHLIDLLSPDYFIIGITHQGDLTSSENQKYHNGNILDEGFLQDLLKKYTPDAIFHLAAIAATQTKDINSIFKINLNGTINLYKSILDLKDQSFDPKIIYISSAEVYGNTPAPEYIDELAPLFPVNLYGSSKLASDRLSYQLSKSHDLKTVILRPFNHTGPGQLKGFFVPDMASQIAQIEKDEANDQILVGNLDSVRDLSDVRDIVAAYKKVLEKDVPPGETFNISSGQGIKMSEVLDILVTKSTKKINIKQDSARLRPSDVPIVVGNNEKFSKFFDWSPKIPIDQTLADTLNYYREI